MVVLTSFKSTSHQTRQSLTLRQNEAVLAVPQYYSGNIPISNETVTTIVEFYREDDVSRVSSNSKDTIQINQDKVPIRFMEMTILDAFRLFDKCSPGLVGRTIPYSSRLGDMTILLSHDTRICIVCENMIFLIKVCGYFLSSIYNLRHFKATTSFIYYET